ncbi:MAG TPA: sigma-70 family RNA polymerase sigma factor [Bacteroidia bacterium]|jgi:RNA polymerase primary sigma factor|nr:sigma-70 family RNA polymerase sigma factor [Bacteroidia bacterium]
MRQLKISQKVTNRDTPGLDKYLQDISRVDMITPDEEVDLAKRIQAGDMEALDKLTRANLRFVVSVAKQYQNRGLSLQDLINEGNLGLMKAAKRFDHSKGFKFISYAVWWIRQTIHQALAENSRLVRLPVNKINTMHKITQATSRLEQEFGREPTLNEIAEITQLTEDDVKISQQNYARTVSMDAPLGGEDDDGSMYDVTEDKAAVSPENELLKESLKTEILRTLSTIPPREADILKLYFGLGNIQQPLLVEEIARRFEISPERVRQIKDKAIRRLRHNSRSKILKMYLGS